MDKHGHSVDTTDGVSYEVVSSYLDHIGFGGVCLLKHIESDFILHW